MSVYARSATAITISIGRQFTLPISYTEPSTGAPISTAGMNVETALTWAGQISPVPLDIVNRSDPAGTATLQLAPLATAALPPDRVMSLRVSYTDANGETDDMIYPAWGIVP